MKSFMNLTYTQSALVQRGWNPYNRNKLNCAQILVTAPDSVQEERDSILWSRGITLNRSTMVAALRTRWNDTKHRTSPHCSPNISDDEEEEDNEEEDDVNDEEGWEMGTTELVFGHDESEDESDD